MSNKIIIPVDFTDGSEKLRSPSVTGVYTRCVRSNIECSNNNIDDDKDGVPNVCDNCPAHANSDQIDSDDDGLGDVCDIDSDSDGVIDDLDVCNNTPPLTAVYSNGCRADDLYNELDAKDVIIESCESTNIQLNEEISILNESISTMYSQEECDAAVNKAKADAGFFVIPVRVPCLE